MRPSLVVDRLAGVAAVIAAVIVVLLMLMTVVDVALRNFGQPGVLGVVEYSATLLAASVYLGVAHGDRMGVHVSTALVTSKLPSVPANVVRLAGAVVTVGFLAFLTWACADRAWYAFGINEYRYGLVQVPVWPSRMALAVGLGLFTLTRLGHLLGLVRALRIGPREPADPSPTGPGKVDRPPTTI